MLPYKQNTKFTPTPVGTGVPDGPWAIAWSAASFLRKHCESPLQSNQQTPHKPVGVGTKCLQSKLYAERSSPTNPPFSDRRGRRSLQSRRQYQITRREPQKMPPLCKGRWHFRKKMTEGLLFGRSKPLPYGHYIKETTKPVGDDVLGVPSKTQ